jgi:DNA segregation ATPase FtsK/SpoIIIE-like protein
MTTKLKPENKINFLKMKRYAEEHGLTLDEVIKDYLKYAKEFEQKDTLFTQVVTFIRDYEFVTISLFQRKFSIDYDRAINLVNQLVMARYLARSKERKFQVLQERYKQ